MSAPVRSAVLTISDTCFSGHSEDRSGPLLVTCLRESNFVVVHQKIVGDDRPLIETTLRNWSDSNDVDLILTTGGTGFTARDVTPEATQAVIDREAPGIGVALITESLRVTPMAMLSRLRAGVRKSTLIINFPGSAKACEECLATVRPVLSHAVDQLRGNRAEIAMVHRSVQQEAHSKVKLESVGARPRQSQYPMVSMDSAIAQIIDKVVPIKDTETISINDLNRLNHRILATDVSAQIAVPQFRASIKDGYAVMASDGSGPRKVLLGVTAGPTAKDICLKAGFCTRISTGAALPDGADAVVQVEDTSVAELTPEGEEAVILIEKTPTVGQDIRPIGCDIALGATVVSAGTELGPIEMGLMASVGVHSVAVYRRPVVAVLSTGDEIVNPGQSLSFGQIWDSNRTTLLSLLSEISVDVLDLGIAADSVDDIYSRMRRGLTAADVLVTTGGVSMGERDLIKEIMKTDFGADLHFGRVNLKPGKPTTFATCALNGGRKYLFGLPGNPVSAFVTFHLFVKPLITCLCRDSATKPHDIDITSFQRTIRVKVDIKSAYKLDDRPELVRAVLLYHSDDMPTATLTGNQRSSRLLSAKEANALVLLPNRSDDLPVIESGFVATALLI